MIPRTGPVLEAFELTGPVAVAEAAWRVARAVYHGGDVFEAAYELAVAAPEYASGRAVCAVYRIPPLS